MKWHVFQYDNLPETEKFDTKADAVFHAQCCGDTERSAHRLAKGCYVVTGCGGNRYYVVSQKAFAMFEEKLQEQMTP